MARYKLTPHDGVIDTEKNISFSSQARGNADWEAYQQWLRAGNTPDPADPPSTPPSRAHPDVPANIVAVPVLRDEVANLVAKLKTLGVLT